MSEPRVKVIQDRFTQAGLAVPDEAACIKLIDFLSAYGTIASLDYVVQLSIDIQSSDLPQAEDVKDWWR